MEWPIVAAHPHLEVSLHLCRDERKFRWRIVDPLGRVQRRELRINFGAIGCDDIIDGPATSDLALDRTQPREARVPNGYAARDRREAAGEQEGSSTATHDVWHERRTPVGR